MDLGSRPATAVLEVEFSGDRWSNLSKRLAGRDAPMSSR
jgi:hypothetical protein